MNYPSVRNGSSSLSHTFGDDQNQTQMKQQITMILGQKPNGKITFPDPHHDMYTQFIL